MILLPIFRNKKEQNYTTIDNRVIQSEELSWKAKGILVYLLSLPHDWDLHLSEVARHATDGKHSLKSGVKELRENGFVEYKKIKDDEGKFKHIYNVYEYPKGENPEVENPPLDNPTLENPQLQSTNKQSTNEQNKYINK